MAQILINFDLRHVHRVSAVSLRQRGEKGPGEFDILFSLLYIFRIKNDS